MSKSNKSVLGYILAILIVIMGVVLAVVARGMAFIPDKYIVLVGVVYLIVAIIVAAITFMHKKKIWNLLSIIIFIACIVVTVFLCNKMMLGKEKLQSAIGIKTEVTEVCVYVYGEDGAKNIEEAKDYTFGILSEMDRENTDVAVAAINEELGKTITVNEYDTVTDLADAMIENQIQAIIMNENYLGILEEWNDLLDDGVADLVREGYNYSLFAENLHKIYQYEIKKEVEVTPDEELSFDDSNFNYVNTDTMTVYISGQDQWGAVTPKSRSDVNILAVVNTKTHKVLLVSTPRDYYIPLPFNGKKDKLTHAGIFGVECSKEVVENIYGIDIDYYGKVNFSGFEALINALGGVTVWSDNDFTVEPIKHYVVGDNELNGLEALAFARERHAFKGGDFVRGQNQMRVIISVINKLCSKALLAHYTDIMDSMEGLYLTDMPYDVIASLIKDQFDYDGEWDIRTFAVTGNAGSDVTYTAGAKRSIVYPDQASIDEAKAMIQALLDGTLE